MTIEKSNFDGDLEIVREELARQLREDSGDQLESIKVLWHIPRPYSVVTCLAVSTDLGSHRFVLKRMKNHPLNAGIIDASEQAIVEYNILAHLYPKFSSIDGCFVPRPVAVLPKYDSFIMEHVEGHLLDQDLRFVHYFSSRTKLRELQHHLYLCGRWLRYFQDFTGRRLTAASAVEDIVTRSHDRLRLIEEDGDRRLPADLHNRAVDFIEKQVAKLSNKEILVTGRHGDFGPWNTLAGPDGVTVLDFFGFREDPLPVDIFSVLGTLQFMEHGIPNSVSRIRTLRERFLKGFGPVPELPESLILLCEALQRIQQIATRIIASDNGIFSRWERSRSLQANVAWFMTAPDESSLWPK